MKLGFQRLLPRKGLGLISVSFAGSLGKTAFVGSSAPRVGNGNGRYALHEIPKRTLIWRDQWSRGKIAAGTWRGWRQSPNRKVQRPVEDFWPPASLRRCLEEETDAKLGSTEDAFASSRWMMLGMWKIQWSKSSCTDIFISVLFRSSGHMLRGISLSFASLL